MQSFRVHASALSHNGIVPYLLLSRIGQAITFDFGPMEGTNRLSQSGTGPTIALSGEALYELLEGKELILESNEGIVELRPEKDELLIVCGAYGQRPERTYQVWLSEIGLAWNMMLGSPRSGIC